MNSLLRFCFFVCVCCLISCIQKKPEVQRSFYYWQSSFQLTNDEEKTLGELKIEKLYIKFFDVIWEPSADQPIPTASITFKESLPLQCNIVPVIFITNETMQNIVLAEIKTLAFKINKKIEAILEDNKLQSPQEIQLDCDWSDSTKEKYFLLLEHMKTFPNWEKIIWSATIRLHQIKYVEKTGVPPVNKGMLMFYNMGNIENVNGSNSIYQSEIAKQYLDRIKEYPLPLDAAIACFSWGLLYENETLLKIIYPLYTEDLPDSFFNQISSNQFEAKQDFYFEGSYIVQGNTLRIETMTPELSKESADLLAQELKSKSLSVILYHLDSSIINHFTNAQFESVYYTFE